MPGRVNRLGFFVEHERMDVHRRFFLPEGFVGLEIEEQKEAVVGPAAAEQPITLRMKRQMFDDSFEFVVNVFVRLLTLLPVENLYAGLAVEMIDVADLADAASGQILA